MSATVGMSVTVGGNDHNSREKCPLQGGNICNSGGNVRNSGKIEYGLGNSRVETRLLSNY